LLARFTPRLPSQDPHRCVLLRLGRHHARFTFGNTEWAKHIIPANCSPSPWRQNNTGWLASWVVGVASQPATTHTRASCTVPRARLARPGSHGGPASTGTCQAGLALRWWRKTAIWATTAARPLQMPTETLAVRSWSRPPLPPTCLPRRRAREPSPPAIVTHPHTNARPAYFCGSRVQRGRSGRARRAAGASGASAEGRDSKRWQVRSARGRSTNTVEKQQRRSEGE
jgi:hypothetical protein